jgi:hypothetical protein
MTMFCNVVTNNHTGKKYNISTIWDVRHHCYESGAMRRYPLPILGTIWAAFHPALVAHWFTDGMEDDKAGRYLHTATGDIVRVFPPEAARRRPARP